MNRLPASQVVVHVLIALTLNIVIFIYNFAKYQKSSNKNYTVGMRGYYGIISYKLHERKIKK